MIRILSSLAALLVLASGSLTGHVRADAEASPGTRPPAPLSGEAVPSTGNPFAAPYPWTSRLVPDWRFGPSPFRPGSPFAASPTPPAGGPVPDQPLAVATAARRPARIDWQTSAFPAFERARDQNKPLVVFFELKWSAFSRHVERGGLRRQEVLAFVDKAVFLRLDLERDDDHGNVNQLRKNLGIDEAPTVSILEVVQVDGKVTLQEVGRIVGHKRPDEFATLWKQIMAPPAVEGSAPPADPVNAVDPGGGVVYYANLEPLVRYSVPTARLDESGSRQPICEYPVQCFDDIVPVRLTLDTGGEAIRIEALLPPPPHTMAACARALAALEENARIRPAAFGHDPASGRLVLTLAVPNHDVTAAGFGETLVEFERLIHNTRDVWKRGTL